MILPFILVALGLFFSLVGICVTFVIDPPRRQDLNRRTFMRDAAERTLNPLPMSGRSIEDLEQKEDWKLRFSHIGVGLMIFGTILQLAVAVWAIVLSNM